MPDTLPRSEHAAVVVAILARLKWFREADLEPAAGVFKPVFSLALSSRHPYPCYKVVVGPTWVTYYKLVGETVCDMESVRTDDLGTVERVVTDMTTRAAAVKR